MGAAGYVALIHFMRHLDGNSAMRYSVNPKDEFGPWYITGKTNAILADIYDVLVAANTKKGHKPKPYPRPTEKKGIGKSAIPISDFDAWWDS
jgi:hypothetical protein